MLTHKFGGEDDWRGSNPVTGEDTRVFLGHRCPWEVLRMAWWNSPMSCPHLCQAKVRGAAIENLGDLAGDLEGNLHMGQAWRIAT